MKEIKTLTEAQLLLINSNMSFAENMGRHYASLGRENGISVEELQQDARFALCEAALRFDPTKGVDFKTYAYKWCYKFIMMSINGKMYYSEEQIDAQEVDIVDEEEETYKKYHQRVMKLMRLLNKKERRVVRMVYGFDGDAMSFDEVAKALHLTTDRVHDIYDIALTKMEILTKK